MIETDIARCEICSKAECVCCVECDNPRALNTITTADRVTGTVTVRRYCAICYVRQP